MQDHPDDLQSLLSRLYDEQAVGMFGWVTGMLGRREDAEDAVHATWLKLARQGTRLIQVDDLTAYAWKALRHHVHSVLRRRVLERLWTPPLEPSQGLSLIAGEPGNALLEQRLDLQRAIARLRPKYRAVVLLVGVAGCTLEEAARRLGVPRGTAASRYHTATQRLRRWMTAGDA